MKHLHLTSTIARESLASQAAAEPIRLLSSSGFEWQETPEGVASAALQRDRFSEACQAMVRLPAGTVSLPHTKSANIFEVMLKGDVKHYASNANPEAARIIGPGAFYSIQAGAVLVSSCESDVPCASYLYRDGAFDFAPVMP